MFNQFRIVIEEKTSIGYKLNLRSNLLCNRIEFASKLHLAFPFTSEYRGFNIPIEWWKEDCVSTDSPLNFQLTSSPLPHSRHIVLHCPITFTAVVVLSLCRVSASAVSFIPESLLPTSLSNTISSYTVTVPRISTIAIFASLLIFSFILPQLPFIIWCHHLMSSYCTAAISIIAYLHRTPPCICTDTFYFTISIIHHNCTSVVILSIVRIWLLRSAPLFLFCTACSTLLLLLRPDILNLIHSYWSSSILYTLIWLL